MGHMTFDTAITGEVVGLRDLFQPCRSTSVSGVTSEAGGVCQFRGRDIRIAGVPAGGRVAGLTADSTMFILCELVPHVAVTLITRLGAGEYRVSRRNFLQGSATIMPVLTKR